MHRKHQKQYKKKKKKGKWLAAGGQEVNPFLLLLHPSQIESSCSLPQRPFVPPPMVVAFSALWDHCSLTRP